MKKSNAGYQYHPGPGVGAGMRVRDQTRDNTRSIMIVTATNKVIP